MFSCKYLVDKSSSVNIDNLVLLGTPQIRGVGCLSSGVSIAGPVVSRGEGGVVGLGLGGSITLGLDKLETNSNLGELRVDITNNDSDGGSLGQCFGFGPGDGALD